MRPLEIEGAAGALSLQRMRAQTAGGRLQARERVSPGTGSASTLILDSQLPDCETDAPVV